MRDYGLREFTLDRQPAGEKGEYRLAARLVRAGSSGCDCEAAIGNWERVAERLAWAPGLEPGFLYLLMVVMLRHFLELVLGPSSHRVDMAIGVPHEFRIADRNRHRLGTQAQETADIDNRGTGGTRAMNIIDLANLVVVGAVNGSAFEHRGSQLCSAEADVMA